MNGKGYIEGMGQMPGGEYENIVIDGAGSIEGDATIGQLEINGSAKAKGKIKSEGIEINGIGKFEQQVQAETIRTNGMGKFLADVEVEHLIVAGTAKMDAKVTGELAEVTGALSVLGNVEFEEINVQGAIKVSGDMEAEKIICDGITNVEGTMNGEDITLGIRGTSKIKSLCGHDIRVNKREKEITINLMYAIKGLFNSNVNTGGLTCEEIEGDNIKIENTNAKIVRGSAVTIGDDCEILRVEYKDSLEVSPKAKIREKIKL